MSSLTGIPANGAPTMKLLLQDKNIIAFIVSAVLQVALYIPWLLSLLTQMNQVSNGFWIGIHFPDTIIELFTFQFTGNLGGSHYVSVPIAIAWSLAVTVYMFVLYFKNSNNVISETDAQRAPLQNKNNCKDCGQTQGLPLQQKRFSHIKNVSPAIIALILFLGVAIAACLVSLIIWRPIIYARYMLCVMGLFIFFLAYTMGTKVASPHGRLWISEAAPTKNVNGRNNINSKTDAQRAPLQQKLIKYMNLLVCMTSMIISLYININFINTNYDESNAKPIDFVKEDIQDDDIILLNNHLNGFVISVNFPDNIAYFYDEENWNCEKAYRAFSSDFRTVYDLDFLEDFSGRIWVTNDSVLQQIQDKYDVDLIKHESFETKYRDYDYSISLVEK
ncbi:MAG: hypothetical protein HFJ19_01970 [Clostridia bacterium]|nr:hypothetical protein [Clostridia bacterium]